MGEEYGEGLGKGSGKGVRQGRWERAKARKVLLFVQIMETRMSPEHMFHGAEIGAWNFTLVSPSKCVAMLLWKGTPIERGPTFWQKGKPAVAGKGARAALEAKPS